MDTHAESRPLTGDKSVPNPEDRTRRFFLQRLATYGLGAVIIERLGFNSATAAAKVPQKAVSYQDKPKDTQRCDACTNFQSPNGCKLVEGEISPQGWCALFIKKA
jgi:hypothetical protein